MSANVRYVKSGIFESMIIRKAVKEMSEGELLQIEKASLTSKGEKIDLKTEKAILKRITNL